MRFRITVMGSRSELRGFLDDTDAVVDVDTMHSPRLTAFAQAMEPFGLVVASPADDDYYPFRGTGGDQV